MESKFAGFCAVAAVLGIISAATGFAGEATKVKASEVYIEYDSCVYPRSPSLALGIVSAVFTIITRIYISAALGSGCCRSHPNSTPISKLLFVLSWVASVVAVLLLLTAARLNSRHSGQIDSSGYITCYVVKPGIFAAGAILALLSAVFGVGAYAIIPSATQATRSPAVALPVMGKNVDVEKNPVPYPPQQYPPQQYPPQQ
ncbi:hypothetical protein L2E82_06408 [Cichorium intybus]|uniref:Uncharacterized protein n=1 Tax=Cichorium intybus TaxID=13427 RepID=A0ACB9HB12_CICIN|nr:hypothetical protein L2E82_06408 [Cichorium intybus]